MSRWIEPWRWRGVVSLARRRQAVRTAAWSRPLVAAALLVSTHSVGARADAPVRLAVFAASSLGEAFAEIEREFEAANSGVDVALSVAGSQVLRIQIEQGAPADVFASADRAHMQALVDGGLVSGGVVFAHNELVLIVPPDNPAGLREIGDLPRARRIVIGTASVPVGVYTRQMLQNADARLGSDFAATVRSRVVSEENNVRLVRAKVELGEADAAVVYRTDAVSSDRVRTIPIPDELNVRADYLIGVVARSDQRNLGQRFVDFVRSARGQASLARRGFETGP